MDLVKTYRDLNGRHQDDPCLINFIKENILIPPSPLPLQLEYGLSMKNLGDQFKQVPVVEDLLKLKHRLKAGFFLEAGAACGEFISNTLYLELKYQWTGLLVEPNPDMLKLLLSKHRNAWIFPHCLSTSKQVEMVHFDASNYNSGIILEGKIKPSQIDRTKPPLPYEREIEMQCFPLNSVLKAMDNPIIDYFSLDIEGAEFAVLLIHCLGKKLISLWYRWKSTMLETFFLALEMTLKDCYLKMRLNLSLLPQLTIFIYTKVSI